MEHTFPYDSVLLFLGIEMTSGRIGPFTTLGSMPMTHHCPALWVCVFGFCIISLVCLPPAILHGPWSLGQTVLSAVANHGLRYLNTMVVTPLVQDPFFLCLGSC